MKTWQKLRENPQLFQKHFLRQKLIQETRNFFLNRGFTEVETPILTPTLIPESYLEIFDTYLPDRKRQKTKMFLSTSPETALKKLLVAGIGNCFEITKSFRNTETNSQLHNPEFTLLEWYRVGATYHDIMNDCEQLLLHLNNNLTIKQSNNELVYQGKKINLTPPWERLSLSEAFYKYAHLDLIKCLNQKELFKAAKKKGYQIYQKSTWEQIYHQIFLNEVEPHLGINGKPTIIYDYPASQRALARLKPTDPRFAERFEFYISALELGDCYTELTDPKEQKVTFHQEMSLRKKLGKREVAQDNDFIKALEVGLPNCSGIAVGMDRLAMLFTNSSSIDEVLYFPLTDMINSTD